MGSHFNEYTLDHIKSNKISSAIIPLWTMYLFILCDIKYQKNISERLIWLKMFGKNFNIYRQSLLYISTCVWVLHTPNPGWSLIFCGFARFWFKNDKKWGKREHIIANYFINLTFSWHDFKGYLRLSHSYFVEPGSCSINYFNVSGLVGYLQVEIYRE